MEPHSTPGEPPPKPAKIEELAARGDTLSRVSIALTFAVIAVFFAITIGLFFELWRFVDVLVDRRWNVDLTSVLLGLLGVVMLLLALRVARRLALVILGLVTAKYDALPEDRNSLITDADDCSALHDLVHEVCRRVSAPAPDEIRIGNTPECYVFEQRQFSFRPQRHLTLVLGLPQFLILSVAELRIIVAHEMVHFRTRHTTIVVFLFRFLESLRRAVEPLQRRWWRWADPIYWMFSVFYQLVWRLAAPIERRQELRADAVSAALYGGELAVRTLLKDWLLSNQFAVDAGEYQRLLAAGPRAAHANVYRFFVERWRDYSPESQEYLERRLVEEEREPADAARPALSTRIALLRSFPPQPLPEPRPAAQLLTRLAEYEQQLMATWRTTGLSASD